jgi:hypothetical protein
VWLRFSHGNGSTMWTVKHRTQDYESEVLDGKTRYVSQRSLFDPTWFGAFRALRDGMLGFQDVEASRSSFTVAQATPAPDAALHTIASSIRSMIAVPRHVQTAIRATRYILPRGGETQNAN